jgi:hypothetical protein
MRTDNDKAIESSRKLHFFGGRDFKSPNFFNSCTGGRSISSHRFPSGVSTNAAYFTSGFAARKSRTAATKSWQINALEVSLEFRQLELAANGGMGVHLGPREIAADLGAWWR